MESGKLLNNKKEMVTKNEQVVTLEGMTRHNERPRWHVYLPPVCKCTTSQHELSFEGAWASLRSMCWGESSQRCRLKTNLCRCSKTFFTNEKVHHFLLQPLNYVLITCIDCKKKKGTSRFFLAFSFWVSQQMCVSGDKSPTLLGSC